jgi:hypothetical protein
VEASVPLSGINNASPVQVAGSAANGHAYLWDSIHGMQDIGPVGKETNSAAVGINNASPRTAFRDGAVHFLSYDIHNSTMRALATMSGGEAGGSPP